MQLKGALGLLEFIKLELKPYCTEDYGSPSLLFLHKNKYGQVDGQ